MGFVLGLTQGFALVLSVMFLTYVATIVVPYVRRKRAPLGDPSRFGWHFLIPCRDEAAVIGTTLHDLRSRFPRAHIWVVDDGSDDATAAIIGEHAGRDPFVHPVYRVAPEARQGKGAALNAAFQALDAWLPGGADRFREIICVVDADGRPADNLLEVCAGPQMFGDAEIGAVQIDVWMVNRNDPRPCPDKGRMANLFGRTLVRLQDVEFRCAIAAIQQSRRVSGTVGMGGNGQLTRLSALDRIAGPANRPWGSALLEDFELGVNLLLAGQRNEFTSDTWVEQEGLYSLRRLIVQRTRWGQGTMQCIRYLPKLWQSPHISGLGALELLYYLAQPWMQLIGTLIYPIPFLLLLFRLVTDPGGMAGWIAGGGWMLFGVYIAFALAPFMLWGPIYRARCEPSVRMSSSLVWGLLYAIYIYSYYITSWRAATRIMRGQHGWAKTRRNAERQTSGPVAHEV